MEVDVCELIAELVEYAVRKDLAKAVDRVYLRNQLMEELGVSSFVCEKEPLGEMPLEEILGKLCDWAIEHKIIPDRGVTGRDLFDTKLMGILTPRPSEVIAEFERLYAQSPERATDYFYRLACDSDYIRTYRVAKDMKWTYEGKYGTMDITVNLSKPEKDPKAIAAAKRQKQTGYPACALCRENEGFAGSLNQAARQSHRLIPVSFGDEEWFLQYSPYVYYNEHCILLSGKHEPMRIGRSTFEKQMAFVSRFPHYMLGSNADLPIVGGSILTHDHMQGGRYTFAMERAKTEIPLHFEGFDTVTAGILYWPLSVIRLTSNDPSALIELSDRILCAWREYSDAEAGVLAMTDDEPHNTVTPIARRRGDAYEIDLVLRNNRTSEEHPLGIFHPHEDKHNIKKENIGLIEVMGLAVLPARLRDEMLLLGEYLVKGLDVSEEPTIAKHAAWASRFAGGECFTEENVQAILQREIGKTFEAVLEDAGVYKCDAKGREAFLRFVQTIG